MNLEEFNTQYDGIPVKSKIDINCSDCGCLRNVYKEKARETIRYKGRYLCRGCSMKQAHEDNPFSNETKSKLRDGRLGTIHTNESKLKMSKTKKEFYLTVDGSILKAKLSKIAAEGHATNKFENARRNGWYYSAKNDKNVYYGSSYELRLAVELDDDDTVESYETQIIYACGYLEDDCLVRYRCLDFLVHYKDGRKLAVEIKPKERLNEQKNIDQISDSKKNAEKEGWDFEVYTEDHFDMTSRELSGWADGFRSVIGDFDWVAFRKEKNLLKAKKYYDKHIKDDKVEVYCEFCKETHYPLKLTFEKNIKRNGTYICEKHGGFIAGSKPKKKKENSYASEGKKACNECKEVKLFECFGIDKDKEDGYATRCKTCRAKKSK